MLTDLPTPYPELNAVLSDWLDSIQAVLGDTLVAAHLQGSFALGGFDADSDVDFLVAIREELSETQLSDLQIVHARIYDLDSSWAKHLEGSYIPLIDLRRYDPSSLPPWYLDNGSKVLVRDSHDNTLVVRWMVRERGITLWGPDPKTLIDPVTPNDLRREVLAVMRDWGADILSDRYSIQNRWAQPFAVLSYARMLQTLQTGTVESKSAAVKWAKSALDRQWVNLIQCAWEDRPNPSLKVRQAADSEDVKQTLEFIEYAIQTSHPFEEHSSV
jgi:predicted nucleotidyltransferase